MGEETVNALGISGRGYAVLALLKVDTPSAQHHLGGALGIDRTSTAKLLAELEGHGYVSRSRDPANRRAFLVTLTDTGEHVREQAAVALAECDERLLASLAPDERERLRTDLQRLVSDVSEPPMLPEDMSSDHTNRR